MKIFFMKKRSKKILSLMAVVALIGTGCIERSRAGLIRENSPLEITSQTAKKMFEQRCLQAGEKIYKRVQNVEGVRLLKLRGDKLNLSDQYALDDPYGSDLVGEGYIQSFFREFYIASGVNSDSGPQSSYPIIAYEFVEVKDALNDKIYKYTGVIDEPWIKDKTYLKGYKKSILNRVEIIKPSARYGVIFTDISTKEERDYWIAGSLLQIIDLNSNEVIGERIGYMYDPGQGSTAGGRAPWIVAANHSCPSFGTHGASSSQILQTEKFVEKVLKPIKPRN